MSFWISSILGKSAMGNKKQKVHENESGSHAPLHLSNLFFVYGSIIARHLSLLLKKSDILKPLFFFFHCRKTEKFRIGNFIFESPSKKSHTKIRNHSRAIDKIRHPFYNKKYSKTFLPERSLFDEKCLSILSRISYASTVLFI